MWANMMTEAIKEAERQACKNSGIHTFRVAYDEVRNNYEPQYMKGGELAHWHNAEERRLMFDRKAMYHYCRYCGTTKNSLSVVEPPEEKPLRPLPEEREEEE
jgi:hypothetical protein